MTNRHSFAPDWASPPGDTILDALRYRGISADDLAKGLPSLKGDITDLLSGEQPITLGLARDLSETLGASVEFWMTRDYQFRGTIVELDREKRQWISSLPTTDMLRYGWIPASTHPTDKVQACLDFFSVSSVKAWKDLYTGPDKLAAFKTSQAFDSHLPSLAAWLRRGEIEAEEIVCHPWDTSHLRDLLPRIRTLTRTKSPQVFTPKLRRLCAEAGVAVVFVRSPSGCRASGATRFLSDTKALVQLSFRYLSDDHFWFALFHEIGHLLLHARDRLFLEALQPMSTSEESEANDFARSVLIPAAYNEEFLNLPLNHRAVISFSRRIGVAPGIVVGQLQHEGRIGFDWLNKLKRQYSWSDP